KHMDRTMVLIIFYSPLVTSLYTANAREHPPDTCWSATTAIEAESELAEDISSKLLYQFAIGGRSVHRCWPSTSEDRRIHRLSFNFLQPSRETSTLYPLLVLPSLSLVSASAFTNICADQSLPMGSTVSTVSSNRVILFVCTLSINSCRVSFRSGSW